MRSRTSSSRSIRFLISPISMLTSPVRLLRQDGHRAQRRAGALPYLQGKGDEGEAPAHHLVQVAQVLYVRDHPLRADRMAGVGLVVPHVGAGRIDSEIHAPPVDDV